jgi:DNA repair exonuclease SbcCD ATPase subunit/DNA repair exonuclease SbcCD nuclease subunit
MKFGHIADTHIKNLKFHDDYRAVFEKMYKVLREEKVDYIIHCGDIAHTKTQISPEFVDMAADFFRNLASIAPTYIILGNHDGNLKNGNRQDALTPIIDALGLPNLHLLKDAGETKIDDKHTLNVLSVFDEDNWVSPTEPDKVNIALYHGAISGVETDAGYVLEHGEHPIDVFKDHDFAFLGDIHKTNQILDTEGRVRYCGSTVQQNHGETNDKGFLLWDIKDKDSFTCKHVHLANPKPFITIELTSKGQLPKDVEIPPSARLRIVSNNSIPVNKLRKAVDVAKVLYKPETVTFLNRAAGQRGKVKDIAELTQEDLRDVSVQRKFIKEYLKDYEPDEDTLQTVFELNDLYNRTAQQEEEVQRNIHWKLKTLKWDNLFNYGESNKIDFEKLNGIIGIFGKNFSGKSSIIDSMLWVMYNSTSKHNRKNLNIINQTKDIGSGEVQIEVGNKLYTIYRKAEKYVKKLKGAETQEAKTEIDFKVYDTVTGEETSLNGMTRNETDFNIRSMFGTIDDFLLTSMASQIDSLSFIGEGSTKRKEILAKFLDLNLFERKFKLARDDSSEIKAVLKKLEDNDYDEKIVEFEELLVKNEANTKKQTAKCKKLKKQISNIEADIMAVDTKISSVPHEIVDYDSEVKKRDELKSTLLKIKASSTVGKQTLSELEEKRTKIKSFVGDFDIEALKEKRELLNTHEQGLKKLHAELTLEERNKEVYGKKIKLLSEVPCGSEFAHCKFIKDAYESKTKVSNVNLIIKDLMSSAASIEEEIVQLNPKEVDSHLNKYNAILQKMEEHKTNIAKEKLILQEGKTKAEKLKGEIKIVEQKIEEYEENKEAIENLEKLFLDKEGFVENLAVCNTELGNCDEQVLSLYKEHGGYEQVITNIKQQKEELVKTRKQYASYDLFQRCMHSNGISLDIIRKRLPLINEEVAKVLSNVVDFEITLENEDKKLEIFIKHPKYDARPLEMGSGAEKTIASMAIRLAFLNVSSMPKPDLIVLDEPGTALDEENMQGFITILDILKSFYKSVFLISHLESLKDSVDSQITIDKVKGYPNVNM